jgi:hypothetical protein
MNIYLITRNGRTDWDEYSGFVVVASTPKIAREMAQDVAGQYDNCLWTDAKAAACRKVGTAGRVKADVLLASFNAG